MTINPIQKSIAILSLCLLASPTVHAKKDSKAKRSPASWSTLTNYEKVPDSEAMRSVLHFSKGASKITYTPNEAPFGLVEITQANHKNIEYFVTTWSQGAATVRFRVFVPEVKGDKPLCEVTSFSTSAKLRFKKDGAVEIETYDEDSRTPTWEACP